MVHRKRNGIFGFRQLSVGWMAAGAVLLWAAGIGAARAQSLTPTATPEPTPAPAHAPMPEPTCEGPSEPGAQFHVEIVPYRSLPPDSLSAAQFTEIPTPTWWPTRTNCPTPTLSLTPSPTPSPTPTPDCPLPFKGPFYRTDQGPLIVGIGQPFRIEIESYHQDWCGSDYLYSEIVYSTDVLRLTNVIPPWDFLYDGPISLDFEAIGAGSSLIEVRHEAEPPVFTGLMDVRVLATTPTLTFTPLPSPSPTPTATPTATPIDTWEPHPSCTPAWRGPFYNCNEPYHEGEVGQTISVTIIETYDYCYCCVIDTNPTGFTFNESIVRLLQRHSLANCGGSQEEWIFQALRPGTTDLNVNYDDYNWGYTTTLTTIQVLASPTPPPTQPPMGWMLR